MGSNELLAGRTRLGSLIDGDERTPEITAMLENTGEEIHLVVPLKGMMGRDPYERWFTGTRINYGDDPDRKLFAYRPPRILMFHDVDGPVALVGCRARGFSSSFTRGRGVVDVKFAVLGARHANYDKINGVRVAMPALSEWTRLRSVHLSPSLDAQGRVNTLTVRLEAPDAVPLSRRVNLTLRPMWRTSQPGGSGRFEAHDVVELMTATKQARDWAEHLDSVAAVRDLMSLSAWRPLGFTKVSVNRGDDPERVLSGDAVGERWADVISHRFPEHTPWKNDLQFLFYFSDIGATGVRRWLKMREHYDRALTPLVAVLDSEGAFAESRLVQTGIALEALGYQILVDAGVATQNKRLAVKYHQALDAILNDMRFVPLDDPQDWKDRSNRCYRGVKHADNPTPDSLELVNTYRENALVIRYWIAGKLGVKRDALQKRLDRDPLSQKYVLAD